MNKKFLIVIFSIVLILPFLIISCSDVPGSLGDDLLTDQSVKADVLYDSLHSKDGTSVLHSSLGSTYSILVGRNTELEAVALVKFNPALEALKERLLLGKIVIDTALVTLTRTYILGNETDAFDYEAFPVLNSWTSTDINVDSLSKLQFSTTNIITQRAGDDTVSSRFHLDKNKVIDWMKVAADTSIALKNYGFMIKPTAGTKKILGFEGITTSYTSPPSLYIVYHDADSNDVRRSLTAYSDADVHTMRLFDSTKYASENIILLQNGVIRDGRYWFDYNLLPKNIVIHYCSLTLTKQKDSPYNFTGSPDYISDIKAYYLSDSASMSVNTSYSGTFSITDDNYTADITSIASVFAAEKKNFNIGIFSSSRYIGADAIAFYSSKATNIAQRPRLKIVYSKRSN